MTRSWAVALRIARRDTRRAWGRSLLVVAMIALPVLGVTAVDVLARTYQLTPAQEAARNLGAADISVAASGQARITQSDASGGWSGDGASGVVRDPATGLPAGSRVVADRTSGGVVSTRGRSVRSTLRELAYADPLARGLYRQRQGRPPATAGEVALTTALADRLGARLGDRVGLPGASGDRTVVGVVADGSDSGRTTVLLGPGGAPAGADTRLLVGLPAPPTWALVERLNAVGTVVTTRGVPIPGQPSAVPVRSASVDTLTAVGLVVGMALLEVVLLAGPAFAVGAKRQERVLALLAATGADRRDVRRTVLASGVVLGAVAGVVGLVGGVVLARAVLPLVPRVDTSVPGPFEVRPLEVLGIALIGFGTAVAAAVLPAVSAARQDVLAALTGRRGVRRTGPLVPLLGLVTAGGGTLLALRGARERNVDVILAGAALAELGLVATTPALVGLTGRLGRRLPAAPRLALRDAARNRARTAPAVSAILAAVAGAVAVGTYVASLDRDGADRYSPQTASGAVSVPLGDDQVEQAPAVVAALTAGLPGARAAVSARPVVRAGGSTYVVLVGPPGKECAEPVPGTAQEIGCAADDASGDPVFGDEDVLRALDGPGDPRVTAALAAGGAAVPAALVAPDGRVTVAVRQEGDGALLRTLRLPAAALPAGGRQQALLSTASAGPLGLGLSPSAVLAVGPAAPSQAQEDRLRALVAATGVPGDQVSVERGYHTRYGVSLLALLAGSALLVLGASGITTGLAAAEGRADLSTLAAVGASPGLRRVLAASQSVVTAGLGSALGVVAGLVPAIGLIRAVNAPDVTGYRRTVPFPTVVPWTGIAVLAVVVPLVAGLAAAALTRSRLPLVRRLA